LDRQGTPKRVNMGVKKASNLHFFFQLERQRQHEGKKKN